MRPLLTTGELAGYGITPDDAAELVEAVNKASAVGDPSEAWSALTRDALAPNVPFEVHELLFERVYSTGWDHAASLPHAWRPRPEELENTNLLRFARSLGLATCEELHRWSVESRPAFWRSIIDTLGIEFDHPYDDIVDMSDGPELARWLPGARLNIARSCFHAPSGHVAVWFQPEGGSLQSMTYGELDRLSNQVANSLTGLGVGPSEAIAIAMPMTVEAVASYLGILKAGCVVVSVADSFAADEIATRLRISGASAVVTQDVVHRAGKTLPMYDKVVDARAPRTIVVPAGERITKRLRPGDLAWDEFLTGGDRFDPRPCAADDKANVLFSSGTTGDPKAIPWTHTTPIKGAMDGYLHHDIRPGDVVAWPTNLGWMMGPWLIFAGLINRASIALYYGAANTREFCRFVEQTRVTMLGVVPSLVRTWRRNRLTDALDWSSIRAFSSTGEASDASDMLFLMSRAGYRPIVEYCGGTEIGGGYITGSLAQPASPSTFTTPAFGLDFCILDPDGNPTDNGELFLVPPSIGLSSTLLNKDHHEQYFAGTPAGPNGELLRRHGDQMERLPGGYYRIHGRTDDTMNLGGIKISSGEIERVVATVDGVLEAAAIAVEPKGGGPSRLVVFTVPEPGAGADAETLRDAMQKAISTLLNPLFRVHEVALIDALPRTASNKVMRRVLRDDYQGPGRGDE